MIQTDIPIIEPALVASSQCSAGLLKLRCHLIDALPQPEVSVRRLPKKPIYDIPAYPSILASWWTD